MSLRAANRSPSTIRSYLDSLKALEVFLAGAPCALCCSRFDLDAFMADQVARLRPSTAATRYRHLQQLYRWTCSVGLRTDHPMTDSRPPTIPFEPVPVLQTADIVSALTASMGYEPRDVRDRAIISLFAATPLRLSELANIELAHLDTTARTVRVLGKGTRWRLVPYHEQAAGYLDDWLATRVDHLHARLPWLWLGLRGRLTPSGVDQALRRRACAAGLDGFHAHQFRHTFAHRWLLSGEREGDLMTLAGWRTRQMLDRYGAAAAEQRAVRAYQRFSTEVAE